MDRDAEWIAFVYLFESTGLFFYLQNIRKLVTRSRRECELCVRRDRRIGVAMVRVKSRIHKNRDALTRVPISQTPSKSKDTRHNNFN